MSAPRASRRKKILRIVLVVVVLAQFVQPDRSAIVGDPSADLITVAKPSTEVGSLLRTACYDCHSNTTTYPWYSYITPVNWWLQDHVNEGREEGNMAQWAMLPERKRAHFVDEAAELVEEAEMPLPSYTWIHGEADLNAGQRKLLSDFFQSLPEAAIEWRRERRKPEREAD